MTLLQRLSLLAVALVLGTHQTNAQGYPARPVTIVVPYAAGGGIDVITRLLAQKLGEKFGQTFVVDNRLGAGGVIASTYVAKAASDGYTLMLGSDAQFAAQVTLRKALPYDPTKDFVPIVLAGNTPFGLVVSSSLPAHSVTDFIRLAKEQPGKLSYGSSGPGGVPHLLTEQFMSMTGTRMTHVPYKGTAQALNDLVAGHVPVTFSGLVPVMGLLPGGKIRLLGVSSRQRVPAVPDAPPIAEAGVPGFVGVAWEMLVAPAGTPKPIVDKLHAEVTAILQLPDIHAAYAKVGYFTPDPMPQGQLGSFIRSEIERWGKIITHAGIAHSQ